MAADRLVSTPMPEGGSLFGGGLAKSLSSARFGCYVSSPNLGARPENRYLYEGFYLAFPQAVLDAAQGRQKTVTLRLGSTTLYAAEERTRPTVVRMARCVIPDAPGALEALEGQATKFAPSLGAEWSGETMGLPTGGVRPPSRAGKGNSSGTWYVVEI